MSLAIRLRKPGRPTIHHDFGLVEHVKGSFLSLLFLGVVVLLFLRVIIVGIFAVYVECISTKECLLFRTLRPCDDKFTDNMLIQTVDPIGCHGHVRQGFLS